jgi:hypothetical protein
MRDHQLACTRPTPPSLPPRSKARVGSRCPDAAGARKALSDARAHLMELIALIVIGPDPSALSEISLTSMDEEEHPPQPAPASPGWMLWAAEQLQMDPEQVGRAVLGGRAAVLGGRAAVLGGRAALLGGRAARLGGRAAVLGGRAARLGGRAAVLGGRAAVLGGRAAASE